MADSLASSASTPHWTVRKLTDLASESDAVKELREKLSGFAKLGITSIQDMSTPSLRSVA